MRDLSFRCSALPFAGFDPGRRPRRTVVEPALPVLLRSVAFLGALAAPFVAALLFR